MAYGLRYLGVDPSAHPLLLVEPNHNTADRRQRQAEIAFEQLGAPAIFVAKASVMAAFSMGKPTAVVLDVGAALSTAACVLDGFMLHRGVAKTRVAGNLLDAMLEERLNKLLASKQAQAGEEKLPPRILPLYAVERKLNKAGDLLSVAERVLPNTTASFHRFMTLEVVRDIKESMCRLADTPLDKEGGDTSTSSSASYELPDGRMIHVGRDRYEVPEALFAPASRIQIGEDVDGVAFSGLTALVRRAVDRVDVDIRRDLYSNVVVVGGSSLFPGLVVRLASELQEALPTALKVKVHTGSEMAERRWAAWIGGSITASLGSFHQMWFSKQEYEEHGVQALARKCP